MLEINIKQELLWEIIDVNMYIYILDKHHFLGISHGMFDLQYDICLSMEYHRVIPPVYSHSSGANNDKRLDVWGSNFQPNPFMNISGWWF